MMDPAGEKTGDHESESDTPTPTAVNTPCSRSLADSVMADQRGAGEVLQEEVDLRMRNGGVEKHTSRRRSPLGLREGNEDADEDRDSGENGVMENKKIVDVGNGPEEVVIVNWLPNDPENPYNWSVFRKVMTTCTASLITFLTAMNLTSIAIMSEKGTEYFDVSAETWTLAVSIPLIAIAVTPLALAPFSELYGRAIIYHVTSIFNALMFIPQIWVHNFSAVLAVRWFQGMAMSVGNSLVGGSVADIFLPAARGHGMNVFSFNAFAGQAAGGLMGYVEQYHGIQWCWGGQALLGALSCILNALIIRETRSDVLLSRRAKRLTKLTGVKHLCAADLQKQSFTTVLSVSLIRPLQYLVTEPIVTMLSLYAGFAWGCVFLGGTSILLVYRGYGFDDGEAGAMQSVLAIGAFLGYLSNYHQEYLFRRASRRSPTGKAPPEARLIYAAWGGLLFPLGLYAFAWTGRPGIPWWVGGIFLSLSYMGVFNMYCGVFTYLADAYETYSSSAQAAQSFTRNLSGGIFPLFARQLYDNLGYPKATTLIASLALGLAACPFLLLRYGAALRARSKVASALARDQPGS